MIPEALHLQNFLSHRETALDLHGVHLASLVGENGAGKSSLLDAITWAVWGRSRAPYGQDESLIYHGENSLEVEYIFRMPYQGGDERRFRILRRREQHSRRTSNSVLDFQVYGDDGWFSLTADSIRDTQSRIIEQIGLDYDTFINSAYLRQGHADEFTVQTPAERKRVLSTILGLDRWAAYQDEAKKRLSETKGRLQEVERRLDEIQLELARRPEYEAQLTRAEAEAERASQRLQEVQAQADELTRLQERAMALQRQLAEMRQRLQQENERSDALQREEQAHRLRLESYQGQIARADDIESQYYAYQEALSQERAWNEKLSQAARLQEEKAQLEREIAQAREALAAQLHQLMQEETLLSQGLAQARAQLEQRASDMRGQIRLLEERVLGSELTAQLGEAEAVLTTYDQTASALEKTRLDLQSAEVEDSRLVERNRQLRELMNEKKAQLDALAEVEEATCPLCRQPLTPEHREQLLTQVEGEGVTMGDEFRANRKRLDALKERAATLQKQIREYEQTLRGRSRQEQLVARLRQQAEQGADAVQRVEALRAQVNALETQLAGEAYGDKGREALNTLQEEKRALQAQIDEGLYAPNARAALAELLAHLAELGYDVAAHDLVKARVQALAPAEAAYHELEKARVSVQGEEEALRRLGLELKAQEARIAQLEAEHVAQGGELAELEPRLAEAPRIAKLLHEVRMHEASARQRVGAARQNLAALQTLEQRQVDYQNQQKSLAQRVAVLNELRDAFGVNGIPAMIIEHTLPELEREANRILQQLTGGRMHVRFETQRETKRGTLRETLDIIISDEKGTRPYETFSGGEQFRVNFAVRVALSRLLAQRAGVRLRSLFVDEGFGALDADGRQRLVEAVKAVQSDFDLVLVITHIEELRDAFPTRIQVVKTESGSQVEVA